MGAEIRPLGKPSTSAANGMIHQFATTSPSVRATSPAAAREVREAREGHQPPGAVVRPSLPGDQPAEDERPADRAADRGGRRDRAVAVDEEHEAREDGGEADGPQQPGGPPHRPIVPSAGGADK
jgi:hypothetical protein